jgi:hypothetical protein
MRTKHIVGGNKIGGATLLELKAGGSFVARIWSNGGPDSDGDYQTAGSLTNAGGSVHVSSWNHSSWGPTPPVGRAVVEEDAKGAIARGRFFLDTAAGAEHFRIVKAAGTSQQWSYGFSVTRDRPHPDGGRTIVAQVVHEISPVLRGAGIGVNTISVDDLDDLDDLADIAEAAAKRRLRDETARSVALLARENLRRSTT